MALVRGLPRRTTLPALWTMLACAGCTAVHTTGAWDDSAWTARLAAVEAANMRSAERTASPAGACLWAPDHLPAAPEAFSLSDTGGPLLLAAFPADDTEPGAEPVPEPEYRFGRGPLPGFKETVIRDFKALPGSLWEDTKRVYTDPLNLVLLLGAGGASAAVRYSGIDDHYEDTLGVNYDAFNEGVNDALGIVGHPGTHFALAGLWYLLGQQVQDTKTYEVGRTLFNALAINGVTTMGLKLVADTDSPNGEHLAWPSGHTSSSFTIAAVLHQAYGHWVGVPLYVLAGLVGFERMDDQEHQFSDVVFGAVLGLVVGHSVAAGHRPEIFGGQITPYVSPDGRASGIAWVYYPDEQRSRRRATSSRDRSLW